MKKTDLIKRITAACVASNPEIMELEFGCEISWQYTHHLNSTDTTEKVKYGTYVSSKYTYEGSPGCNRTLKMAGIIFEGQKTLRFFEQKDLKILGRPIRLADIANMIQEETHDRYHLRDDYDYPGWDASTLSSTTIGDILLYLWNFEADDLTLQDLPTLEFINSLLPKN